MNDGTKRAFHKRLRLGAGAFGGLIACMLSLGLWSACAKNDHAGPVTPAQRLKLTRQVFDLCRLRESYRGATDDRSTSAVEYRRLTAELEAAAGKLKPLGAICPEADLQAFDFARTAPGRCRLSFLFRTKGPTDRPYSLMAHAFVDPAHEKHLTPQRDPNNISEIWAFHLSQPETNQWKPGDLCYYAHEFDGHSIPYRIVVRLYWYEYGETYGQRLDLGWFAEIASQSASGKSP